VFAVDAFGVAGSEVGEVTVAVLLIGVPPGVVDGIDIVIMTGDVALAAIVAREHKTLPLAPPTGVVHDHPGALID